MRSIIGLKECGSVMPRRDCGVSAMLEMMEPAFVRHPNRKIGESVGEIDRSQDARFYEQDGWLGIR